MIFGHAFLFPLFPAIIKTTPGLVYYFGALFFVLQFTNWVVLRKELSVLDRAPTRLPLSVISRYQAKRQSLFSLALGFFACMFYVVISSLAVKAGFKPLFGWGVILLFSLGGIACGYMSFLKLTISKENKNGINKMDAY